MTCRVYFRFGWGLRGDPLAFSFFCQFMRNPRDVNERKYYKCSSEETYSGQFITIIYSFTYTTRPFKAKIASVHEFLYTDLVLEKLRPGIRAVQQYCSTTWSSWVQLIRKPVQVISTIITNTRYLYQYYWKVQHLYISIIINNLHFRTVLTCHKKTAHTKILVNWTHCTIGLYSKVDTLRISDAWYYKDMRFLRYLLTFRLVRKQI